MLFIELLLTQISLKCIIIIFSRQSNRIQLLRLYLLMFKLFQSLQRSISEWTYCSLGWEEKVKTEREFSFSEGRVINYKVSRDEWGMRVEDTTQYQKITAIMNRTETKKKQKNLVTMKNVRGRLWPFLNQNTGTMNGSGQGMVKGFWRKKTFLRIEKVLGIGLD